MHRRFAWLSPAMSLWLLSACGGSELATPEPAVSVEEPEELGPTRAGQVISIPVRLVPQAGVAGRQRVNLALPLPSGLLQNPAAVRVLARGAELGTGRRVLARHRNGSIRSLQLQVEVNLPAGGESTVELRVGETATSATLPLQPVEQTLLGSQGPRVWALLPASWLSSSGVGGPLVPEAAVAGSPLDAWGRVCDYVRHGTDVFLPQANDASLWLFDRATALYRGYLRRGDLLTLRSAYREASLYRETLRGTGAALRIGVPGKANDLKYHYVQNLALHYLLTGDDRFCEAAEDVAARVAVLWPDPGYAGGSDFWTERHAGFALLAYVWAAMVSDDRAAEFRALADKAAAAALAVQETFPHGYREPDARCFAHSAEAHGEPYGYFGCSPWMSAILAEALDAYATERGGAEGRRARAGLVKLARILARNGRDTQGRPYYWMGVGVGRNEPDPHDEHWGESAYIVAMGYYYQGRSDPLLRQVAYELLGGLRSLGRAPHLRSFNWQCRTAVATPFFLQ